MPRALIVLFFLIGAATAHTQNVAWLQGSWKGKSYLPGSDATQYFALTLRVVTVKGNKFEGFLSTMEPYDSTVRYDVKISGEVLEGYLLIDHSKVIYVRNSPGSRWQLSCINCKPVKMMFALQNNIFSIKGTTEECYKECIGVKEFKKTIDELSPESQDSVYALMHMEKPKTDVVVAAKITVPDTAAQRTALIPAGNVIAEDKSAALLPGKVTVAKENTALMPVRENNPPPRTPLITAGNVVQLKKDIVSTAIKPVTLKQKNPSLSIKENDVAAARKIPVSTDTIAVTAKTEVATPKNTPVLHDTASLLPAGYAERKVNVVKTLPVNTDSITVIVYDNGVIDGDIVSVVYNDKVVIDKLSLTARSVSVKIPVNTTGINTLVFHAHNLGEFPPNTARLEIIYGNKKEELTISSDYTISSSVNIVYRK